LDIERTDEQIDDVPVDLLDQDEIADAPDEPDEASQAPSPAGETTPRTGGRWGDAIGEARKAELQALLATWDADHGERPGPFARVRLSGADVFWLAIRALAGPKGDPGRAEERLRRAAEDDQARAGLKLSNLLLRRADLRQAHLEGAILPRAHLMGANLRGAHLQRAHLRAASLEGASLVNTRLQRADLSGANLRGADLRGAAFDKATRLNGIRLDGATIDQGLIENAAIGAVEWGQITALGGERLADRRHKYTVSPTGGRGQRGRRKRAAERTFEYRAASRTYRALSIALRAQALNASAARFRYRALVMARKAQFHEAAFALVSRRLLSAPRAFALWLLSYLLGATTGYGEFLGRLVVTYLLAIGVFTAALLAVAGLPLSWESLRDALVFSLTAFHGRGSPPPGLAPTAALATLSSVEGIVGLVVEGLLIGVIVNKLTKD
jgi:pentapeptide repeat protein